MKWLLLAITTISIVFTVPTHASAACQSVEARSGNEEYDHKVCAGLAAQQRKNYRQALRHYEQATEIALFEAPNYALFTRIALMHHYLGRSEDALKYLEIASLSLSISIGRLRCPDDEVSPVLIDTTFGKESTSRFVKEAVEIMCGGMYEGYYPSRTFSGVIHDAHLIEQYLAARRVIAPHLQD